MDQDKTTFEARKRFRQKKWTGQLVYGFDTDMPFAEGTIVENLESLEQLRRMMYPELIKGRIDKRIIKKFIR
jgi:hypothetical protein